MKERASSATRSNGNHRATAPPAGDLASHDFLQLTGRNRPFLASRWFSFRAAFSGVYYTLRTQPNAWIELAAAVVVSAAAWWFDFGGVEWALLGLTFCIVLAMEALNTAIETTVDLVSPRYHPLAKVAKDTAAGALIFAVLGSICVASALFGPRLWALIF